MNDGRTAPRNQGVEMLNLISARCAGGFLEIRTLHRTKNRTRFLSIPPDIAQAARFAVSLRHEVSFGLRVPSEPRGVAHWSYLHHTERGVTPLDMGYIFVMQFSWGGNPPMAYGVVYGVANDFSRRW